MSVYKFVLPTLAIAAQAVDFSPFPYPGTSGLGIAERQTDPLVQCLQNGASPTAAVETQGQTNFLNDSVRYATIDAPSYKVVMRASSVEDIANSIKCATQYQTPFLATSARHGFSTTLSSIVNGLEIDTGFLNNVQVDAGANRMTIGGAAIFQEGVDALYANGKEMPTGSCYCVGWLGGTLGGGVGRLSGLHGMMIDSLESVNIMLPNTTIVEASEDVNAELFWGLRGAGFNFGVVLNATYQVYDQVPQGLHLNADFMFPLSQAETYYANLSQLSENQPAPLSVITYFAFDNTTNQSVIIANAVYAGPEDEGRPTVQFLVDQNPIRQNISMIPWNRLNQESSFGLNGAPLCAKGSRRTQWGVGVDKLDPPTYGRLAQMFDDMIAQYPTTINSVLDLQLLPPQGVRAHPTNSTAYPWRDIISHNAIQMMYNDDTTTDESIGYPAQMRETMASTAGTNGFEVYVSYSHGDETVEQLYSAANLPRLAALKKEIDPSGLFNAYHPLPTQYP